MEKLQIRSGIVLCPVLPNGLPVRHNRSVDDCQTCDFYEGTEDEHVLCRFKDDCEKGGYALPGNH